MDNTIIQQGTFSSKGKPEFIALRSDIDWMRVYNFDTINAQVGDKGYEYYWQRGMQFNQGFVSYFNDAGTATLVGTSSGLGVPGFILYDSSMPDLSDLRITSAITAGPHPTVDAADTSELYDGDIVRVYNTAGAEQISGMDFTIDNLVGGASFDLAYMRAIVAAANPGTYRKVQFGTTFYPTTRFITRITNEDQALVTMSVDHDYEIGQMVRFIIPKIRQSIGWGMPQLNELQGAIVAIDEADVDGFTNTIRVNIDTSGMDPFVFPISALIPFSPALVVPIGEDTAVALDNNVPIDDDATDNLSSIGMILGYDPSGDALSPAGTFSDIMIWQAGKSFSVTNEVPIELP